MRFLSDLRLILNSILGSMGSLFWSLVVMTLIFYVFSLMLVQQIATRIHEAGDSTFDERWDEIVESFGTVQLGMLSLYQISTGGGDWAAIYKALEAVGPWTACLYLFFIAFTQIAVMNILTGIFVENAMKCAEPDKDFRYLERLRKQRKEFKELNNLIREIDTDGSGCISIKEFRNGLYSEDSPLRKRLLEMGLRPLETELFFEMMIGTSASGEVDVEAFVSGITKIKGPAASIDLQNLAFQAKIIQRKLDAISRDFRDMRVASNAVSRRA